MRLRQRLTLLVSAVITVLVLLFGLGLYLAFQAYVLNVTQGHGSVDHTLAQARLLVLGGSGVTAVLASGSATLLIRHALAPLTQLTQAAASIAATEQYHERVPVPGGREDLGQLAATINQLIMKVERTLNQQRAFLADTSHELRSPLTVVLANLHLLRRDLDPEEREFSVAEATAEAQRMRRLINELLLLATADATLVIAHAPVRLDQLVIEAVASVQRQASGHQYQVTRVESLVVMGDEERLTQLVRNLLENAAAHTPSGTQVDIRVGRVGTSARLIVADTGPGIAAANLPQLWDRYYRVDKVRSRASGGTGLGLPIVKYIAEAHGGTVSVDSTEGVGTTFTIELPLAHKGAWN